MQSSTPVRITGVQIGFVADIKPLLDKKKVLVTLDLEEEIQIPKNTTATILSTGFMGGKAVDLTYDRPCSGDDCAQSGDYLLGKTAGMLSSMLSEEEMNTYLGFLKDGLSDVIDTLNRQLLSEEAEGPLANSLRDLQGTLANLKSSTGSLERILTRSSGDISETLANLHSITDNLSASNEEITGILSSTGNFTSKLNEVDIAQTISEVEATLANLKTTLTSAEAAFDGVNGFLDEVETGDGTLSKLMQDESLYLELSSLSERADSLINDIQDRPYRYVPFKSRRRVKKFDRKDAQEGSGSEISSEGNQ